MSKKNNDLKYFVTCLMWPPEGKANRAAYIKATAHVFGVSDRTTQNVVKSLEDEATILDMGLYDYLKTLVIEREKHEHKKYTKNEYITGRITNSWPDIDELLPFVLNSEKFGDPLEYDIVDDQEVMTEVFSIYAKILKAPKITAVLSYYDSIPGLMDWNKMMFVETWEMCFKGEPIPDVNTTDKEKIVSIMGTTEGLINKIWYRLSDVPRKDVVKN